jgi:hypothetical protein
MSDHIPDLTKMIGETPRTNLEAFFPHESMYQVCDADFTRRLERELNAANERIKRLEVAGDRMASILKSTRQHWYSTDQCEVVAFDWNEAKEAKP